MKRKLFFILMTSICPFALVSCNWGGSEDELVTPNLRALETHEREMVFSSAKFAVDLFHQLREKEDPNQFYSPYSIHQALSMAMNGNEGEVLEEFIQVLRYEGMGEEEANAAAKSLTEYLVELDPKVRLSIANAIWYKQEFQVNPPFKESVVDYYDAEVAGLDMGNPQSVNVINQWIESNTEGLIKDMLDAIPANAVMYLVNAIYFKADWKYRFETSNTQKAPFHVTPSQKVEVDMMQLGDPATMRYFREGGLEYLEIPYSTGHYNMAVITADNHDLDSQLENFTFEQLEKWRENAAEANYILRMPKFNMRYKMEEMKEDLMEMGLQKPFNPNPANFTRLFSNPTEPMYISRVIHDALIEVDEKGTEAAAATAVEIGIVSTGPHQPRVFTLDRPFVFLIQDNHSGAILFMGKLGNPALLK